MRKEGVTTLAVRQGIARVCGVSPRAVSVPALKDRWAVAVQHMTVPGRPPRTLQGDGWSARSIATVSRPIGPRDLAANRFALVARDLGDADAMRLGAALQLLAERGLPNVFDRQRFGSFAPGEGFPGEAILRRDATGALRRYLWAPMLGDSRSVRAYKEAVAKHWADWSTMFDLAPKPSNYRSVLTFLRDHPDAHRKALNLVPDRLLSLWLSAYQSWLWNRALAIALAPSEGDTAALPIAPGLPALDLPLRMDEPDLSAARRLVLPLPHVHAAPDDPRAAWALQRALTEAALEPRDLKARILQRAYVGAGDRAAWVVPDDLRLSAPEPDASRTGRLALRVAFTLPPGSYATFVMTCAATLAGNRAATRNDSQDGQPARVWDAGGAPAE